MTKSIANVLKEVVLSSGLAISVSKVPAKQRRRACFSDIFPPHPFLTISQDQFVLINPLTPSLSLPPSSPRYSSKNNMSSSRRSSNGRSPLVNQQRQITSFFTKKPTGDNSAAKTHSISSPTPSPSPRTNSPPSVQSKRKKPLLVIGGGAASSSSPGPSPLAFAKEESYGDGVVGKKIKVYWPLDKTWYEGRVKTFDEKGGKHLVQYDDAEEEMLVLRNEKIEWVEESAKKFKRLRRGSSSPLSTAVMEDIEDLNDGNSSDDSRDEDWGKNVENEMSEEEDVELVEEDEDGSEKDGVGKSRRKQGGKVESKKRQMSNGEKVETALKKSKSSAGSVTSGGSRLSSMETKIKSESEW